MLPIQPMIFKSGNEMWVRLSVLDIDKSRYLISNYGNIYDIFTDKIIKQIPSNKNGYLYVFLINEEGKRKSYTVHRLVGLSFVFGDIQSDSQVNHINGDKHFNYDENLEWASPAQNTRHAFLNGLAYKNIGENHYFHKITQDQAEQICQLLDSDNKYNYSEILNIIGMEDTANNRDLVGNIKRGISWRRVSMKYSFSKSFKNKFGSKYGYEYM